METAGYILCDLQFFYRHMQCTFIKNQYFCTTPRLLITKRVTRNNIHDFFPLIERTNEH